MSSKTPILVCGHMKEWCTKQKSLNEHKDRDNTWSVLTVVSEERNTEIICYFVFPELKIAVPMRDGDMLGFNATTLHCVSSRRDPTKEAYCISLYSTTKSAEANDRNVVVNDQIGKIGKWVDAVRKGGEKMASKHRRSAKTHRN